MNCTIDRMHGTANQKNENVNTASEPTRHTPDVESTPVQVETAGHKIGKRNYCTEAERTKVVAALKSALTSTTGGVLSTSTEGSGSTPGRGGRCSRKISMTEASNNAAKMNNSNNQTDFQLAGMFKAIKDIQLNQKQLMLDMQKQLTEQMVIRVTHRLDALERRQDQIFRMLSNINGELADLNSGLTSIDNMILDGTVNSIRRQAFVDGSGGPFIPAGPRAHSADPFIASGSRTHRDYATPHDVGIREIAEDLLEGGGSRGDYNGDSQDRGYSLRDSLVLDGGGRSYSSHHKGRSESFSPDVRAYRAGGRDKEAYHQQDGPSSRRSSDVGFRVHRDSVRVHQEHNLRRDSLEMEHIEGNYGARRGSMMTHPGSRRSSVTFFADAFSGLKRNSIPFLEEDPWIPSPEAQGVIDRLLHRQFMLSPWVKEKRVRNQLRLILKDYIEVGPQRRSTITKIVHDAHQLFPIWRSHLRQILYENWTEMKRMLFKDAAAVLFRQFKQPRFPDELEATRLCTQLMIEVAHGLKMREHSESLQEGRRQKKNQSNVAGNSKFWFEVKKKLYEARETDRVQMRFEETDDEDEDGSSTAEVEDDPSGGGMFQIRDEEDEDSCSGSGTLDPPKQTTNPAERVRFTERSNAGNSAGEEADKSTSKGTEKSDEEGNQ